MLQPIRLLIISISISGFMFADVFMTEFTDPQNSSDAGRYVELHNNGDSSVDLSSGWTVQRWTNANADPTASSVVGLTGSISPGGFYIICNDAGKFSATYGETCDQDIGTGGFADSNGDDNMALLDASGSIVDMFGVAGEDGSGTGHEFEDGRAERAADVTAANATWTESEWNIDNDSGGGDGNQYAPEGFDPSAWIGATGGSDDVSGCMDDTACNYNADATMNDGSCLYNDCAGECGGDAFYDACDICGGDDSSCSVDVTFSVDMNLEGIVGDVKVRTSTVDGEYNPSDWFVMDDSDGDLVYTYTLSLATGVTYGYNFNNSDGSGYEAGSYLEDCGGGNYGNDRSVMPGDADMMLDTVCWESCDACPTDIPGCTDDEAENFNENATEDDGSCIYGWPDPANLFLSEYAEGSSNNKYLEIYNATDSAVDLGGYSLSSCSNGCDDGVSWDYPNTVEFNSGTMLESGDVYVVCHGSADDLIQAECNQTHNYLSNGDDVYGLTQVGSGAILDIIGTIGDDPGSGWEVSGVSNGTKDHTLVREASVASGNAGDWSISSGSEWVVLDQNEWAYLGSHPHEFSADVEGCTDPDAINYNSLATIDDNSCEYPLSSCADIGCDASYDPVNYSCQCNDDCTQYENCCDDYSSVCTVLGCTDDMACNYSEDATEDDGSCSYAESDHDCEGNCTVEVDCAGYCGGGAMEDCAGECYGNAIVDECGVCDGNDADQDCTGVCFGDAIVDECGECDGDNTCLDCAGVPNGGAFQDCMGQCADASYYSWINDGYCDDGAFGLYLNCPEFDCDGTDCGLVPSDDDSECVEPEPECAYDGDANGDGTTNVTDIVLVVGGILSGDVSSLLCSSDMNEDGLVNVTDIVFLVGNILNGTASNNDSSSILATDAIIEIAGNKLSVEGVNGDISGIQLVLNHGHDFKIILEDTDMANFEFSGIREINQNTTELFLVKDDLDRIGITSGEYDIVSIIAVTGKGESTQEISSRVVELPDNFVLSSAYPNPFNPTTTLELAIPEQGYVSVKVYNLVGQEVATLIDGIMDATPSHTFQWNAGSLSSGFYLVKAEGSGQVTTQKLMLLK